MIFPSNFPAGRIDASDRVPPASYGRASKNDGADERLARVQSRERIADTDVRRETTALELAAGCRP
ncbi:hypothetical protein BAL199_08918 [alpha proteobacterium BAL199]|nr:hypothetical protein BAL199_08918 [alpha proteobacterium BAL199]